MYLKSEFTHACAFPCFRSTSAPAGSSAASSSNRRLQQTQNQVDEVVDIMRVNVDKVLERDQKLSELDDRADALQAGASQFETSAAKLKRKYWWKNCKVIFFPLILHGVTSVLRGPAGAAGIGEEFGVPYVELWLDSESGALTACPLPVPSARNAP
ncbi:unnamed protein product [Gulo gulo]|uniref:V-SNARE coiled-coil homology domain-containing protein n=1 Tax=Gulo gulo TaxID=48420 RepID=A0A9X9LRK1_GULGU|nr:unnamed protein product [Gulo gulo]